MTWRSDMGRRELLVMRSIRVKLYNHSGTDYRVKAGDKISQLVILPILAPSLELMEELGESERGENGFGSTGR